MNLPEFVSQDPEGYIRLSGHRIGIQDIAYFYNEGYSPPHFLDHLHLGHHSPGVFLI